MQDFLLSHSFKSKITLGWGRDGRKHIEHIVNFPIWSRTSLKSVNRCSRFWLKGYGVFFWLNLDFIQPNPEIYQGLSELKGQTPFTLESSANFLQKYCVWSPRPPLKVLSIVVLDSNSSSIVFFPGHQMNTQPLTMADWAWQCHQHCNLQTSQLIQCIYPAFK